MELLLAKGDQNDSSGPLEGLHLGFVSLAKSTLGICDGGALNIANFHVSLCYNSEFQTHEESLLSFKILKF